MARSGLHGCALLLALCAFLSVFTGAAVSANEERPFFSLGQAHLWIGAAVGVLTMAVLLGIHTTHQPFWLRRLGWIGAAAIAAQIGLGLLPLPQAPAARIAHAGVAQLFFPLTVAIAAGASPAWDRLRKPVAGPAALRLLAACTPCAVLAQVALGTLFRHGALDVGPHLIGAFLVSFFILGLTLPVIYRPELSWLRVSARVLLTIASIQVFLGLALFSMQAMNVDPAAMILITMSHAAIGAVTLAATVVLAVRIRRGVYVPD